MKAVLALLLFPLIAFSQQPEVYIDFSGPSDYLEIDTTNPNNIWQIGKAQKTFMNLGYDDDYAIITDTTLNYAVNNTSSFILKTPKQSLNLLQEGGSTGFFFLEFQNKIQSDSLKDFGLIELSLDSGATWCFGGAPCAGLDTGFSVWHPGYDTYTNANSGFEMKNYFSGNSNQWQREGGGLGICAIGHPKREAANNQCVPKSIWFRFSFISDSIPNNLEGWQIDNIGLYYVPFVGYKVLKNKIKDIELYPNPSNNTVTFNFSNNLNYECVVYDIMGKAIKKAILNNLHNQIYLSELASGSYVVELSNNDTGYLKRKKIIVSR